MRKNLPVTEKEVDYPPESNLLSMTNPKGVITYANPEFAKVAGYTLEELEGQAHNLIRHPDMPQAAFEMMWDTLNDGQNWMGIVKNRCKNGDHYWVDAFATPIQKDGKSTELQSVRVKPEREWVERAKLLYAKLQAGYTPPFLKRSRMSIITKMMGAVIVSLLLGIFAGGLLGSTLLQAGIIFVITSALLACSSLWYLWKPMQGALDKAKSVTSDPVAMHVYTGRNDEVGQLLLAMKMLNTEKGGLVGRISDDSRRVSEGCEELLESVKTSNSGISDLHMQVHQIATATNEMSASILEVANSANTAAESADAAQKAANEGKGLVNKTAETIAGLAGEIESASEVIEKLEQDSEGISSILEVIRSVAEQTNLLALNAAIEAARAGDQGRGFAVVADEVRTLATRTHESTEEITAMIEKLQSGSQAAVQSMKKAQSQTQYSVEKANDTTAAIDHITDSINQITDMNRQIATAVEEQSTVAEEINRNITTVSNVSNDISAAAETTEKVGAQVKGLSNSLQGMARQFFAKVRQN